MSKAQRLLEFISGSSEQVIRIRYGNEDSRKALNRLLSTINYCATAGCSRMIHHAVDGDGAYSLKIKGLDETDLQNVRDEVDDDPIKVRGVE